MKTPLLLWVVFLAVVFIWLPMLVHCQTTPPPLPTLNGQPVVCANGNSWKLNAQNKWFCPALNVCARTCTYNTAAPASQKCVNDFRKDSTFVNGVKGSGKPVPFSVDDPDLFHVFIYGPSETWDLTMLRDKQGNPCNFRVPRYYYGEFPLGDPRNLLPSPKVAQIPIAPTGNINLSTELLPLK